jgi:hypothetical protein
MAPKPDFSGVVVSAGGDSFGLTALVLGIFGGGAALRQARKM